MFNNFLIPPGFKDEVTFNAYVEHEYKNKIIEYFKVHGFDLVKTPLIEFKNKQNDNNFLIESKKRQDQLKIRNDITPQIIRIASSRLIKRKRPLKLCYYGEVIRKYGSMLRPERQFLQVGAETIGENNIQADLEIISIAYKALSLVGIKNITIELSSKIFLDKLFSKISNKSKLKKFVIKPNRSGSSFGIRIIKNQKEFDILISNLEEFKRKLNNHKEILIEEYISGRELTVSTIKIDKEIHALAVTEIKSKNNFFDYKAKYSKGYAKHILPAKLNKINYAKCLKFAINAHKLLGCNSLARTDFIFDTKKNKIFFLETNTQPGLTPISLLPEQANYKNLSFSEIIFILIKNLNY